eukprot:CAMPEP_0206589022 /NCGR_PEP_ID=MMETSP0325_2-20121206/38650_1 /ASSEMBLY_ACC=CAM_ASM_000347 /TAXON_ID=2866 /ORGANISM="Crypthecodinium cohnii, Strain Seligo" /LENGTH=334 /DNA_ID=CAMNT_0054097451 /DNA_START=34 /DNA_END=1035 /DNA_ORIENTATION=-
MAADAADTSFTSAFGNALGMIFATEIGDKTFFIAAILAMSQARPIVFGGAIGALIVMTVLSTAFGHLVPTLIPPIVTHWASILLFVYFGGRMLWSAAEMYRTGEGTGVSEELEEVEQELAEKGLAEAEAEEAPAPTKAETVGKEADLEEGGGEDEAPKETSNGLFDGLEQKKPQELEEDEDDDLFPIVAKGEDKASSSSAGKGSAKARKPHREVLLQAFLLTFLAEWGDRSQIATIVLAASQDPFGVTLGACIGHSICTGIAVLGGRFLASRISERSVALGGGVLFFIFAFLAWLGGPPEHHKVLLTTSLAPALSPDHAEKVGGAYVRVLRKAG